MLLFIMKTFDLGKSSVFDSAEASLFKVLKDHNCEKAIKITRLSYRNVVANAATREGYVRYVSSN